MQPLEKALDDTFKKVPQLPEAGRKGLASAMPWLTLAGGILTFLGVWGLYNIVSYTNSLNTLYGTFGYVMPGTTNVMAVIWVSLAILLAQAVVFLVAFPALRAFKKSGWNLLFYAALINVVYDVVYNLFNGYLNLGGLIMSLIGAAIGLYLLFQIRPYYTGAGVAAKTTPEATEKTDKKA